MDDATQEPNMLKFKLLLQLHVSNSLDKVRPLNVDLCIDLHTHVAKNPKPIITVK